MKALSFHQNVVSRCLNSDGFLWPSSPVYPCSPCAQSWIVKPMRISFSLVSGKCRAVSRATRCASEVSQTNARVDDLELEDCGQASEAENVAPFRIFVSTGDVMGDIHGANLVKELLKQAQGTRRRVEVYALGGQRMRTAGATLIGDNTGLSSIGLLEALPLIVPSLLLQITVRRFLDDHPPHVLVLIDYPGVNIPFGQYVKQKFGCKIIYYIPPNEWLWNTSRTKSIVSISDIILAVYPGEAEYYARAGANVKLVGHPLIDTVKGINRNEARQRLGVNTDDIVIALVPASRSQELRHVWPTIASAAGKLLKALVEIRGGPHGVHFIIPAVLRDQRHVIEKECEDNSFFQNSIIFNGDPHEVLAAADVAITKSGSTNLEMALYKVPQVVVYKIDNLTAWIARKLFGFSVKNISLVNLILDSQVVPEYIQEAADAENIMQATLKLLPGMDTQERSRVLQGYEQLRVVLGEPGVVERVARQILDCL
ncbi:lipid-A-disaccharide synthase [Marchantia polymorpha subsp. ruderalis]